MNVRCGCGRTMTLDALRGKGAYRCGCGARITITLPDEQRRTRCAWPGCALVPVRDYEVPLCADHAKRLKQQFTLGADVAYKAELARRSARGETLDDNEQAVLTEADLRFQDRARLTAEQSRAERESSSRIYFLRHDRIIKIGYSVNPQKRAQTLAGAVILATEPGQREREEAIHAKFSHLRLRGEWFSPGPDLIEYINQLRAASGVAPITADGEARTSQLTGRRVPSLIHGRPAKRSA